MDSNQTKQLQELIKWTKEHIKDSNYSELTHNITPEDKKKVRFQILVATLISARTTDAIADAALSNLLKIEGGLSCENMLKTDKSVIEECITKVSFRKRKAQNIKDISKTMLEKYDGDIPKTK
ncbi:hypothetical protein TVAG_210280 [Trichomonas vaginalis G3]|uniref:HhH-GPD domain-containing protein n=1 Tax=Trichomonas vaginalis (strain ATCC PRA-98 / G3) TaxID=412133 RepID=A2DVT5_TRIV3|nr:oxidized pyrimidine nucleobase lesion DNA N-glycosylase protein [Trichomonas vaginalis G3]EAY15498.1 hypothetical protein TVAG_210280 [Trichomonas vaginalis G3]KAI5511509.1 oxidized pyrimidine nucleobase lesion DNA N-glycosylase protein [Trichomonas vaginalis G3]|eukprot:XP_001327721.1 hypothetical protein [Trichomonas vaginalis G3]